MKKNHAVIITLWALTLLWILLCFFLSWQTGEQTASVSLSLARVLQKGLRCFRVETDLNALHMALRKAAHFGLFFVLGALTWATFEVTAPGAPGGNKKRLLFAAAVTLLALFSEVPKFWIPGRHLTWSEALLNAAGAASAFLLLWSIGARKKRPKKE